MRTLIVIIMSCMALASQAAYKMEISINGKTLQADMADNQATAELKALLENGSISVNLQEYGGFERVGSLPQSFTTSDQRINAETGDIVLYLGNQIVFMLGSNSWSYTQLGHINADRATLESFFGSGNCTVTLSLPSSTSVHSIDTDKNEEADYYDLYGRKISGSPHGLVIERRDDKSTKVYMK